MPENTTQQMRLPNVNIVGTGRDISIQWHSRYHTSTRSGQGSTLFWGNSVNGGCTRAESVPSEITVSAHHQQQLSGVVRAESSGSLASQKKKSGD